MSSLDSEIQEFVAEHSDGWSHGEWEQFRDRLADRGVQAPNPEKLGALLEAERLRQSLLAARVNGLGRRRVDAIVERFGSVWNLRHANVDDVASIRTIPRHLAEETLTRIMR